MARQGTRGLQIIQLHIDDDRASEYNSLLKHLGNNNTYTTEEFQSIAAIVLRDESLVNKLSSANNFNTVIISSVLSQIDRAIRVGRELGYLKSEDNALLAAKEKIQNANLSPYDPEVDVVAPENEPFIQPE